MELWIVNAAGRCERVLDLARLSKHMPASLAATASGTFLIAFVDRMFEVDLVEIDAEGQAMAAVRGYHRLRFGAGTTRTLPSMWSCTLH
jgi:hypothetical protein